MGVGINKAFRGKRRFIISSALSPLNLITPKAPIPGGVASATTVSFHPDNFKLIQQLYQALLL
jgi:hypothetical protein